MDFSVTMSLLAFCILRAVGTITGIIGKTA